MQSARRCLLRGFLAAQRVNQPPVLQAGSPAAFAAPCLTAATTSAPATSATSRPGSAPAIPTCAARAYMSSSSGPNPSGAEAGPSTTAHGMAGNTGGTARPGNPVLQRYSELLESGSLQRDEGQLALVRKLARLYDDICSYRVRMDEYHRATEEHQARRLQRLHELLDEEATAASAAEEQKQRSHRVAGGWRGVGASVFPGLAGSTGSWLGWGAAAAERSGGGAGAGSDSPLARARQAAVRREERLDREVGPPPRAPEPPKGLYVWGSVGSGKSMLVAMFYQALMEHAQLPASRWMHFNAAMLEIHSRLHYLDTERWRQRDERERLHQQHRLIAATATTTTTTTTSTSEQTQVQQGQKQEQQATVAAAALHDDDEEAEEAEEDEAEGGVADGPRLPVPAHRQGVFRHWDPRQDPEVQRQREAKAAMLAVRRHMRLARLGRNDPRTLAAANAQGLVRMAASFIRGVAGDPRSGWGHEGGRGSSGASSGCSGSSGPIASVLYFDEVQVTDVFSAVALKGLVEALTCAGCVVVVTSNRAPRELPRHGLHEDMWGHFVDTLLQRCAVHELSSPDDYRRVLLEQGRANIAAAAAAAAAANTDCAGTSGSSGRSMAPAAAIFASGDIGLWPPLAGSYFIHSAAAVTTAGGGPGGAAAELERLWRARALAEGSAATTGGGGAGPYLELRDRSLSVPVLFGRSLEVRRVSTCGGAAWFSFPELCGRPLGPADYVALSQRFHTVFLEGIPAMSMQVRDQARRFITLLDELYNGRCVLVASAAAAPEQLFAGAEGADGEEPILDLEGLQFETAVEGARLRRDVMAGGGVAPVAASPAAAAAAAAALGGAEERFAFRRAVSRLLEMQSPQYIIGSLALRRRQHMQLQ